MARALASENFQKKRMLRFLNIAAPFPPHPCLFSALVS